MPPIDKVYDYSQYGGLKVEKQDKVMTITLNAPEAMNAFSAEMHYSMSRIWEDVQDDPEVNVVVLGVRPYSAHRDLAAANEQLLNYAKNGGVVVVQYETARFDHGPYAISLGDAEKVVDETAPVKLLMPESAVLTWPNRISEHDFDGWVEERGHSFMESWDAKYEAPLETHDPEQEPQKGGLLVAKTGKGTYIYVSYALYRQLPEGVPGAYRLFANLLSVGKNPR